jgi:hypothetical protein
MSRLSTPLLVPLMHVTHRNRAEIAASATVTFPVRPREPLSLRIPDTAVSGRIHLYVQEEADKKKVWKHHGAAGEWNLTPPGKSLTVGLTATPGTKDGNRGRSFVLNVGEKAYSAIIAPVLLTSSLDPVDEVFVVRNRLTAAFCETLTRLLPKMDGKPALTTIPQRDDASDIWMQDTTEIARFSVPAGRGKIVQGIAPLTGLRSQHDMGLNCAPLDATVREHFEKNATNAVPITTGESLPKRRWIDWFGNLEVSPPVNGFPHGRILTGEQKGLRFHPDLLAFLEAQQLQWPPLYLDVSWLTIGHVDELIHFVPAKGRFGFRALLPSPALARTILEDLARTGQGKVPVFAGKKGETTVQRLLDEVAKSEETARIETSLLETRARLKEGLGLETADICALPVLFKDGLPVIPNGVNGLVIGRDTLTPDPCGPVVDGKDRFQAAIREQLAPLGVRLHFVDIWEPYHTRSGEIHCGTNAVRRLRKAAWWNGTK